MTGEPTSEQDTTKEMKQMSTSSLWVQQEKPSKWNSLRYEHRNAINTTTYKWQDV